MSIVNNNTATATNSPETVACENDNKSHSVVKSLELFEENENGKPPLSKFLNQVINFHSIMPSTKEINDKSENTNAEVIRFL